MNTFFFEFSTLKSPFFAYTMRKKKKKKKKRKETQFARQSEIRAGVHTKSKKRERDPVWNAKPLHRVCVLNVHTHTHRHALSLYFFLRGMLQSNQLMVQNKKRGFSIVTPLFISFLHCVLSSMFEEDAKILAPPPHSSAPDTHKVFFKKDCVYAAIKSMAYIYLKKKGGGEEFCAWEHRMKERWEAATY